MLALVCRGEGHVELALDHPRPVPAPGWAVVRVLRAGICTTDLELITGYLDFQGVLGHEFCGVVHERPGDRWWEGRRVVGEINITCGECGTRALKSRGGLRLLAGPPLILPPAETPDTRGGAS